MVGYYGFMLDIRMPVCQSVRPSVIPPSARSSVFGFQMITWVNINGFSSNLVCALILWRSGFRLLMGKFRQIFTEFSVHDTTVVGYYNLTFLFSHLFVWISHWNLSDALLFQIFGFKQIAEHAELPNAFMIGAGGGPAHVIGVNCEVDTQIKGVLKEKYLVIIHR